MRKAEVRFQATLHAYIPQKHSLNTELETLKVTVSQIQRRALKSRGPGLLLLGTVQAPF